MDNLVVSNIMHRRTRSAITAMGVGLGVALIILAVGLVDGFLYSQAKKDSAVTANIMLAPPAASFGFGFSTSLSATMPIETEAQVREVDGVRDAVPIYQYLEGARMIDGMDYDSFIKTSSARVVDGEPPRTGDQVMIDRIAQHALKLNVGDKIELLGRPFRVTGIYAPESLYRFKIPISTVQAFTRRPASCSLILISVNDGARVEDVYARLKARFPDHKMILTRDLPALFVRQTPAMQAFLGVIAGLSIAISIILILLTMYSTVKERTRQIGVLKALGASRTWIAAEIEKEALVISFIGVVAGYAFAIAGKYLIEGFVPTLVRLEPVWFVRALCIGLLAGAVGALYPAIRAAQQDPVEALAYE
ncbi:MAG TPA: ABC transporter permease [Blastocatellia bacterium]|nr:ABC transporter permease [Blastocatellia bacterium]